MFLKNFSAKTLARQWLRNCGKTSEHYLISITISKLFGHMLQYESLQLWDQTPGRIRNCFNRNIIYLTLLDIIVNAFKYNVYLVYPSTLETILSGSIVRTLCFFDGCHYRKLRGYCQLFLYVHTSCTNTLVTFHVIE